MCIVWYFWFVIRTLFISRANLTVENLALRQHAWGKVQAKQYYLLTKSSNQNHPLGGQFEDNGDSEVKVDFVSG